VSTAKDLNMTLSPPREIAYLDIADPMFSLRSERVLAAREAGWYARTPYGLAILRYAEVAALLQDRRLGQGSKRWPEHNGVTGDFTDWWHRTLINLVGEDHKRQRRLINPAFSPRVVDALAPSFREIATELIDEFVDRGECDFVSDFTQPFATLVICKLVGVGEDRWQQLAEWTGTMGLALGVTIKQDQQRIEDALDPLSEFADEVVATRRQTGGSGDTVAHLMAAHDNGQLTELELREVIVNMFFGGVETTRNQLGIAVDLFIQHPDQWELLADRPDLAGAAVEEIMRARPTTTWVTREALEDLTFQDVEIARGTTVHLLTSVIGSDAQQYGEDVHFDITAERPRQFGFGGGLHHCLGHFLARRDMAEALTVLSQRLSDLHYAGPARWLPDSGNTGPIALPIGFTARR
jgi:cytochrome P450